MKLYTGLRPLWLTVGLFAGFSSGAAQTTAPDDLAAVRKQADSITTVIGTALAQQDTALLASALSDTVGIVLPGNKKLDSKAKAVKYFPLLMQTVGGGKLEKTRLAIEKIAGYESLAREAGTYRLTRVSEAGVTQEWRGQYTIYWKRNDTELVIERLFVTKQ